MKIEEIFYKKIDRNITGVVKIGQEDEESTYQELDEYVVTRELSKHMGNFFDSYKKGINDYTDKMGVWISGFFGSGKSHFLKILAYLLQNKEADGKKAAQFFEDKIKDPIVLADIHKTSNSNADVILFNIDSKSDSDSKINKDAIVKVFMKVFNEQLGYCGSIPWVADMERQLVKDKTYIKFKEKFKEIASKSWEESREDFYFEEDSIVEALKETTKMSEEAARNWYSKAEENYSLSIEKFATRVKEYIESKDKDHHIIFLVDEIGQYIGGDSQLMLNLQTVVEDLGTQCGGKAWVLVTSQQDIDSITKVKGNDFSKIQGRFNTRLNLSSANVDEVIKARILRKKEDCSRDTLKLLYNEKSAIIKNLITFTNAAEMKTYNDEKDFIDIYPFIPYQFNLLQSAFTGIRYHSSTGKHLSEGERSLLGAFQEVAKKFKNEDISFFVPFSAFFDTIYNWLDNNIRTVIIHADDNKNLKKYDLEVLKVLFLIRYVKELPSNIENISTLLVTHVDDDKIELKKKVEASLRRLYKETLIQKNGDEYIFLTNDEQDINREIQNEKVELEQVLRRISDIVFLEVYKNKKFTYGKYNFTFNQLVDDIAINQKSEIGLKFITPYYETNGDISLQELKLMSVRDKSLIVKLPSDTGFLDEMEEVLKIESYFKKSSSRSVTNEIKDIVSRKTREKADRLKRVSFQLIESIKGAKFMLTLKSLT